MIVEILVAKNCLMITTIGIFEETNSSSQPDQSLEKKALYTLFFSGAHLSSSFFINNGIHSSPKI